MSHRTQITLTDELYERLLVESSATGTSLAELVRRSLTRTYGVTDRAQALAALDRSFGSWDRDQDGAAWVAERRRGLGHRLEDA